MDDPDFLCALDITPPPSPDRSRRENKLNQTEEAFEEQKRGWRPRRAEGNARERAERCYYLRDWEGAVRAAEEALAEDAWGPIERREIERLRERARERREGKP